MQLAATRLTPDVEASRQSLVGRVDSVHRAAIYIDPGGEPGLLVVAIQIVGGPASGVLVQGAPDLARIGVQPGMSFVPAEHGWSIPAAGAVIDATRAAVWSPALPPCARLLPDAELANRIAAARILVDARASAGGLWPTATTEPGDPWLRAARPLIEKLQRALVSDDSDGATALSIGLVGLGAGLTPSGDDFLVGLLAGMEASGHPLRKALADGLAAASDPRTTMIGARAIELAARGAYAERLRDVIVALGGPNPWRRALVEAIERALAYGATSGADTLAGLFAALDLATAESAALESAAA